MDGELRFPEELSTDVKKSYFYLIESSDITSEEDLDHLIRLMFEFSDRAFYLVSPATQGTNHYVLSAEHHGVLKLVRTERQYYPHPNFKRDYIKIDKENPEWDWEKEVRENAPEHIRCTMELTERWRRKLELGEALSENRQKESDESPLILHAGSDQGNSVIFNYIVENMR